MSKWRHQVMATMVEREIERQVEYDEMYDEMDDDIIYNVDVPGEDDTQIVDSKLVEVS